MVRKQFSCGFAAGLALAGFMAAAVAHAADLPAKAPALAAYNWTGFYAGENAGYGWHDPTASFSPNDPNIGTLGPFIGASPPISFNIAGPLGGLQLGYNWQFNPNWVAGVEADFDIAKIKGNGSATYTATGLSTLLNSTADETVKWFGTVRARLGYLPTSNLLVYETGGLAYGRVEQNASILNQFNNTYSGSNGTCAPFSTCYTGTSSRIAIGWTVGAGAEYALMNNWTFKAEYLLVNLGSSNNVIESLANASGASSLTANFSQTIFHVVRGGLNYRF